MKNRIAVFLVGTGILILLGSALLLLGARLSPGGEYSLPEEVANMPRTSTTTGSEAITEVGGMHGKQFPIISAAIGQYGKGQATVWIAEAESDAMASQMVTAMQERIAQGNSPFTPLEEFQESERALYLLEGMGPKHYYFQSKELVIWLAASPALADQAIQELLEAYP